MAAVLLSDRSRRDFYAGAVRFGRGLLRAGGSCSLGFFWIGALAAAPPSPAPSPAAKSTAGSLAGLPWSAWFENTTISTDKKSYVHILWDANAVRSRFEGKENAGAIAEAGRQLASLRYPPHAVADEMRVDIVFVTERDGYGRPRWDTLQRAAHLEFSRKRIQETGPRDQEPGRGFEKFEIFR